MESENLTYKQRYRLISLKNKRIKRSKYEKEYYHKNKERIKEQARINKEKRVERESKLKVLAYQLNQFFKSIIILK